LSKVNGKYVHNYLEPIFWPNKKNSLDLNQPVLGNHSLIPQDKLSFKFNTWGYIGIRKVYNPNNLNFNLYFLRESALVNFFGSCNIDIPLYLKPLKRHFNILLGEDERRLTNLLMLKGKKEKNLKTLVQSLLFYNFTSTSKQLNTFSKTLFKYLGLVQLVRFLPHLLTPHQNTLDFKDLLVKPQDVPERGNLHDQFWRNSMNFNIFNAVLSTLFEKNLPIFTFYIQKTDKNILKYSRGKSSKYALVWKYVPRYKRKGVVAHWLKKEVKLQKVFKYRKRIEKAFEAVILTPDSSLTVKLRRFVHKFVFYKYKKKLLKSLNVKS